MICFSCPFPNLSCPFCPVSRPIFRPEVFFLSLLSQSQFPATENPHCDVAMTGGDGKWRSRRQTHSGGGGVGERLLLRFLLRFDFREFELRQGSVQQVPNLEHVALSASKYGIVKFRNMLERVFSAQM